MAHTIDWDNQGQPVSTLFGDRYFSKHNGLAETNYVFLQHNQLLKRFIQLKEGNFVIAETGFGTGLNFLATWHLWQQHASAEKHLHFISVEKYPLDHNSLQRALMLWPELEPFVTELLKQYPDNIEGFHRLVFPNNVTLTLIFDDATHGFSKLLSCHHPSLSAPQWSGVDVWFLDGFAPAKNPDMWSDSLFKVIATLSKVGATLATFTASGVVKHGLMKVGFNITKVRGYGHKRDMIIGTYTAPVKITHACPEKYNNAPWMVIRDYKPTHRKHPIAVIGGGIAGCHTAYALIKKGYEVKIFERAEKLAQGASGNIQGVVYAKLSPNTSPEGEFNLFCLLYAQQLYDAFWQTQALGQQCGVLQLINLPKHKQQYRAIASKLEGCTNTIRYVSALEASLLANTTITSDGLFFPKAGWLQPAALCQWLCQHSNITVMKRTSIHTIKRANSEWELEYVYDKRKSKERFHTVVIANAHDANHFSQTTFLPTKKIRGQVTHWPEEWTTTTLKTVVCGKGYIAPAHANKHCLGASFNLGKNNKELSPEDHLANVKHIQQQVPALLNTIDHCASDLEGRVGFRCTTPDYLPIVGAVPVDKAIQEKFSELKHNARYHFEEHGMYYPNLYINVGYGSRGLAYSPLCSEWLASLINGSPPPLPTTLSHRLNPARFIIRELIRSNTRKK